MYDGIKLFLEWVGYFFIAYLIGYSTFLFLSVVVGSLELYKHRRQEMFKSILPSDYYLPISIIVPAYNEEVTVADTVRSLLTRDTAPMRSLWWTTDRRTAPRRCWPRHLICTLFTGPFAGRSTVSARNTSMRHAHRRYR